MSKAKSKSVRQGSTSAAMAAHVLRDLRASQRGGKWEWRTDDQETGVCVCFQREDSQLKEPMRTAQRMMNSGRFWVLACCLYGGFLSKAM